MVRAPVLTARGPVQNEALVHPSSARAFSSKPLLGPERTARVYATLFFSLAIFVLFTTPGITALYEVDLLKGRITVKQGVFVGIWRR